MKIHEGDDPSIDTLEEWERIKKRLIPKGMELKNKGSHEELRNPNNNHLVAVYFFRHARVPEGGWILKGY